MANYKNAIHDKLIEDFQAFQFEGGQTMFDSVRKAFYTLQGARDCLIVPGDPGVEVIGNTSDDRFYTFTAVTMEEYEASASQAEMDTRIARLGNIEDRILDYLQKVPNSLDGAVDGVTVYKINVSPSRYEYQMDSDGASVVLYIQFVVHTLLTPQLLG